MFLVQVIFWIDILVPEGLEVHLDSFGGMLNVGLLVCAASSGVVFMLMVCFRIIYYFG